MLYPQDTTYQGIQHFFCVYERNSLQVSTLNEYLRQILRAEAVM